MVPFIYKPWLHTVVTIAEYVCDDASKKFFKLSTRRLQVFPVKDQYFWYYDDKETKPYLEDLKNIRMSLGYLQGIWKPGFRLQE